jgi:sialic acid synthase SpsE
MGQGVFIIAEAGVNHNGSFEAAIKLVDAAKRADADAVKFQTFITEEGYNPRYAKKEKLTWAKSLELSQREFEKLIQYSKEQGILFLSTPFDVPSVVFLDKIGVLAFKVASTEVCDYPLLRSVAATGKPVIMSTGMAKSEEIKAALDVIKENRKGKVSGNVYFCGDINLLYCVSLYPTPYEKVDLKIIANLEKKFNVPVGLSDHSIGSELAIAAVALGARIIEKHIKLDASAECPDANISLSPDEFKKMVASIRKVEMALQGKGELALSAEELEARKRLRKGISAARNLKKGEIIKENDLLLRRPAGEIGLENYFDLIGKVLSKDKEMGEFFTYPDFVK